MESPREAVANAVARWAGEASPSPFNERQSEFNEFIDLTFAVEEEAERWINNAPFEYFNAAISLVQKPPHSNWDGWKAFNGSEYWDFYLVSFIELWTDRFIALKNKSVAKS